MCLCVFFNIWVSLGCIIIWTIQVFNMFGVFWFSQRRNHLFAMRLRKTQQTPCKKHPSGLTQAPPVSPTPMVLGPLLPSPAADQALHRQMLRAPRFTWRLARRGHRPAAPRHDGDVREARRPSDAVRECRYRERYLGCCSWGYLIGI